MLWRKAWLETRWRFLIGVAVLICSAAANVLTYPQIVKLIPAAPANATGEIGAAIRESVQYARTFPTYIWFNWFHQNLLQWATLFAALLGSATLFTRSGGALFTLSLPVTRTRLIATRAAAGLAELLAIVVLPSLLICAIAPSIGQRYAMADAFIHSLRAFVLVAMFFALAFVLSIAFDDVWRAPLITLAAALVVSIACRPYLRTRDLPWPLLAAALAITIGLLIGAGITGRQRDF